MQELPIHIKTSIFKDFLFKDFLFQFRVHFEFRKPENMKVRMSASAYFDWNDTRYTEFMVKFLSKLEPRFYNTADYIFEEGDEVDEHIFVIRRDPNEPSESTGCYAVGFSFNSRTKYFHVKLGSNSIICGYENLFDKTAEYTYKALMHVDAYGLRKADLKHIFADHRDYRKQMSRYTLEFYMEIIRKPMLKFKQSIYGQVGKRQRQDSIML